MTDYALWHTAVNTLMNLQALTGVRVHLVHTHSVFGLYPTKGSITPGSDADVVLFDPDKVWTISASEHHSRIDYSLFEGREVTGRVKKVFLRGNLIVDGSEWLGREGMGRFLKRGSTVA